MSQPKLHPVSPSEAAIQRLCFPLDYPNLREALKAAEQLAPAVGVFKVGLELFVREGPAAVAEVKQLGRRVFLDLKLHDIPNTVAAAVVSATELGVDYLTIHAAGGPRMLRAAAEHAGKGLNLLAVTVLTSMDASELSAVGIRAAPGDQVPRLAAVAKDAGLSGLVCSVQEVAALRAQLGPAWTLVTPGIRPAGAAVGDQKRVGTPASATLAGSSLLVVGRPIRNAPDPLVAAQSIAHEIAGALSGSDA